MFGLNWLKRRLKRRMQPIEQPIARKMVNRLSLLYAFLGWNFVSYLLYKTWKIHIPDGPDKIQRYVDVLGVDHADVIKMSGFSKVNEFYIDRREEVLKDKKRGWNPIDLVD